jgi:hypothetical protein
VRDAKRKEETRIDHTCRERLEATQHCYSPKKRALYLGKSVLAHSGSSVTPGHNFSSGVPSTWEEGNRMSKHDKQSLFLSQHTLKMQSSSSTLERPGKRGLPVTISAWMQPEDQTSIEVLYCCEPSSTSGGRYHSVTTSLE